MFIAGLGTAAAVGVWHMGFDDLAGMEPESSQINLAETA